MNIGAWRGGGGKGGHLLRVTANAGSVREWTSLRWRFGLIVFTKYLALTEHRRHIGVFVCSMCDSWGVGGTNFLFLFCFVYQVSFS